MAVKSKGEHRCRVLQGKSERKTKKAQPLKNVALRSKELTVSKSSAKLTLHDNTGEATPRCNCGVHPNRGTWLFLGNDCSLHCQACYKSWREGGNYPVQMQVHLRPPKSPSQIRAEDAFFLPSYYCEADDRSAFEQVQRQLNPKSSHLWKKMHFSWACHSACQSPSRSKQFKQIEQWLADTFHMQVESSRLNLYGAGDWKPLHHDKHVFRSNGEMYLTVGMCLGAPRSLVFAHESTGQTTGYTLHNGDVYAFGPGVNANLLHGIEKRPSRSKAGSTAEAGNAFSIIVWGVVRKDAWKKRLQRT